MSAIPPDAHADPQALQSFIDKWLARWPEWGVAQVFVPASQRQSAVAWFALRHELTAAAWAGTDRLPGEAKLAWWAEELQGWAQGRRRHPLGIALQRLPAPWIRLAAGLPALLASREPAIDSDQAIAQLEPFAEAVTAISTALLGTTTDSGKGLLAEQLLLRGDAAVPLRSRARTGGALPELSAARAWAGEMLQCWAGAEGNARSERIHAALVRERLRRFAAGSPTAEPASRWRSLWIAWRAARA